MRHVTPVVHRVLEGSGGFVRQGLRSTGDSTGALDVDGEDKHIKKDAAVKKAVDRINSLKVATHAETATVIGVPQNVYLEYIKEEILTESNFLELPWTIMLVVSFAVLVLGLLQRDTYFALQDAIQNNVRQSATFAWSGHFGHKNFEQVDSIAQFWSWMRLGLLPLLVQPSWTYSEAVNGTLPSQWLFQGYLSPAPVQNDYLRYAKLLGGIRLRQVVAGTGPCTTPSLIDADQFTAWLQKPCVPSNFAGQTPQAPDAEDFAGFSKVEHLFPDLDSFEELQQQLRDMEDGCNYAHSMGNMSACRCEWCRAQNPRQPWFDERTVRVEVSFVIYNAQYGVYTYVSINFFLNRAGHMYKLMHEISSPSDPFDLPADRLVPILVAGAIWGSLLLSMLVLEIKDVFRTVRTSRLPFFQAVIHDYFGFWNIVDWAAIASGALAGGFWLRMALQAHNVNILLPDVVRGSLESGSDPESRWMYQASVENLLAAVENLIMTTSVGTVTLTLYPIVVMLRLFKSFQAQPRLAIVTATIKTAVPDLMHFSLVIVCVFGCLFVSSILFFGQDLEEFSTPEHAFRSSCLAVLGHWDWGTAKEIGYFRSAIWLWIFCIILSFVALKMVLAIILDAYAYEKEKASDYKTLVHQASEALRRRRQRRRGERVNLRDVFEAFRKEAKGDIKGMMVNRTLITPDSLMNTVPKMPFNQALRTLSHALERQERVEIGHLTEEGQRREMQKNLEDFQQRMEDVCRDVEAVAGELDYFERLQASGDATYDFYFGEEHLSQDKTSKAWIHKMVSEMSGELNSTFSQGLDKYREWQGRIEGEQTELHEAVTEMQSLVQQHTGLVREMTLAVDRLLEPGHTVGLSSAQD